MTSNPISPDFVREIKSHLLSRQDAIEELIRTLVEIESPSGDIDGVTSVVNVLSQRARELKAVSSVQTVADEEYGPHLIIEAFPQQQESGQILFVGHTDTVHSLGS